MMMDDMMRSLMPADKLEEVWKAISKQHGELSGCESARVEAAGAFSVVITQCRFRDSVLDVRVTHEDRGRLSGFHGDPHADGRVDGWGWTLRTQRRKGSRQRRSRSGILAFARHAGAGSWRRTTGP